MRKTILILAALMPAPAMAYEVWCMPTKVCHGTKCKANSNEEVSVRITNPDGPQTMMRAYAEDVAMVQTIEDNNIVRWTGSNEFQITMILEMNPADMSYKMTSRSDGAADSVFTGYCEVQ